MNNLFDILLNVYSDRRRPQHRYADLGPSYHTIPVEEILHPKAIAISLPCASFLAASFLQRFFLLFPQFVSSCALLMPKMHAWAHGSGASDWEFHFLKAVSSGRYQRYPDVFSEPRSQYIGKFFHHSPLGQRIHRCYTVQRVITMVSPSCWETLAHVS